MENNDLPKVSVVILNYNGADLLDEFVPLVAATQTQLARLEIIIADNGSSDDSAACAQRLADLFSPVEALIMPVNRGFAGGYNEALRQIEADYYVLLNSDVAVDPHWLDPMIQWMEQYPELGAVQPKMRWRRHPEYFEYAGAGGGFIDRWGYPFCRGRIFQELERDQGQYDAPIPVHWASGACLMIRADLYHDLGGLDADFFAHMEEIDLCWRMQHRGYRLVCEPRSVVYHVGGATLSMDSPRKTYLNFRNNLALLHKNLPFWEHLLVLGVRLPLDLLAALKDMVTGRMAHAVSVGRAWGHYLATWSRWSRRRRDIQPKPFKQVEGRLKASVVWAHFVRNKKRFSQIAQGIAVDPMPDQSPSHKPLL